MTRQKKEILRRIEELHQEVDVELALSYGCVPDGALDVYYDEICRLEDELARLRHFRSREAMLTNGQDMVTGQDIFCL